MTATEAVPELVLGQAVIEGAEPADGDLRCWSVTTINGIFSSKGLEYWMCEQVALAAVNEGGAWRGLAERDPADAVKWLIDARYRKPRGQKRTSAELGTDVHSACETYALTGVRPKKGDDLESGRKLDGDVVPFLDQFDRWLQDFQPSYQATEVTVYSPTFGYAGTSDAFMTVGGFRFIIDYKTSKKSFDKKGNPTRPYPEVARQLAAYRYAELAAVWRPRRFERYRRRYYLLSEQERKLAVPVPEVDGAGVLHITPEHCELYPVRADEEIHESFLHAQECARFQFQTGQRVIGAPLLPPPGGRA